MKRNTIILGALIAVSSIIISCKTTEGTSKEKRGGERKSISAIFSEMDTNNDGKLSKNEIKGPLANEFSKIDANNDGFISKEELENAPKPERNRRPRN